MKLMRKYRVFVCAVLILCFFSFQISRPRQALAIVPAVSLAAAAVLAVGAAAGLSYTFDNADAESIAGRLQAFLDDVHPGTSIANYFSARGAAVKDGLMYIGKSLYNRIKEFLQWESTGVSAGSSTVITSISGIQQFTWGNGAVYNASLVNHGQNNNSNGSIGSTSSSPSVNSCYVTDVGDYITFNSISQCIGQELVYYYSNTHLLKLVIGGNSETKPKVSFYVSSDAGTTWTSTGALYSIYVALKDNIPVYLTFGISNRCDNTAGHIYPVPIFFTNETCNDSSFLGYGGYVIDNVFKNFGWTYEDVLSARNGAAFSMDYTPGSSLSLTASDVISYPEVSDGQSVCVDVGMLTGSTIDDVADEIIDAAIDGTLSSSISAETWTVDVVTTPQELAQDLDTDLTTEVEDNPTVPDSETIEFDTPSHYTVRDLRQFFPFCIPFDLFDMLGVLAAQPVAPHFEYRFQPGIANIDYTIVIDFQQFDSVALLLRRLETLSFCVGLAMVTRNLIRG